jgi:hypothetical protein
MLLLLAISGSVVHSHDLKRFVSWVYTAAPQKNEREDMEYEENFTDDDEGAIPVWGSFWQSRNADVRVFFTFSVSAPSSFATSPDLLNSDMTCERARQHPLANQLTS